MITIIDYQVGNLTSIKNMLKKIGSDSIITSDTEQIANGEKFILPGVGSFEYGIEKLKNMSFFQELEKKILVEKKPILGVCLGAQLLFQNSEEGNNPKGLCWLEGEVVKFNITKMEKKQNVPHMGWNTVESQKRSVLLNNFEANARFYFVHSYHIICRNREDELLKTYYGYPFVSAVERENIIGVQFHPEKSHRFGLELYKNFASIK